MIVPHHVYIALLELKTAINHEKDYAADRAHAKETTLEGSMYYIGYVAAMGDALQMLEKCIDTL